MHSEIWIKRFGEIDHEIKSMRAAIKDAAQPHGLSANEAIVLLTCTSQTSGNRGVAQRDLCTITTMSAAAVSGHLDALRQQGRVESTRDDIDRRQQFWTTTTQGEATVRLISASLDTPPKKEAA